MTTTFKTWFGIVAVGSALAGFGIGAATFARADDRSATPTVAARPVATATTAPRQAPPVAPAPAIVVPSTPAPAPRTLEIVSPRVRRLVVTSGVEHREPVDAIETVSLGGAERVFAFVDLAGGTGGDVEVTFEHESGRITGLVQLEVPADARRHRTWAFTRGIREEGRWTAVVRDEDGAILASDDFVVTR